VESIRSLSAPKERGLWLGILTRLPKILVFSKKQRIFKSTPKGLARVDFQRPEFGRDKGGQKSSQPDSKIPSIWNNARTHVRGGF
jgi:hypothetical protein